MRSPPRPPGGPCPRHTLGPSRDGSARLGGQYHHRPKHLQAERWRLRRLERGAARPIGSHASGRRRRAPQVGCDRHQLLVRGQAADPPPTSPSTWGTPHTTRTRPFPSSPARTTGSWTDCTASPGRSSTIRPAQGGATGTATCPGTRHLALGSMGIAEATARWCSRART